MKEAFFHYQPARMTLVTVPGMGVFCASANSSCATKLVIIEFRPEGEDKPMIGSLRFVPQIDIHGEFIIKGEGSPTHRHIDWPPAVVEKARLLAETIYLYDYDGFIWLLSDLCEDAVRKYRYEEAAELRAIEHLTELQAGTEPLTKPWRDEKNVLHWLLMTPEEEAERRQWWVDGLARAQRKLAALHLPHTVRWVKRLEATRQMARALFFMVPSKKRALKPAEIRHVLLSMLQGIEP